MFSFLACKHFVLLLFLSLSDLGIFLILIECRSKYNFFRSRARSFVSRPVIFVLISGAVFSVLSIWAPAPLFRSCVLVRNCAQFLVFVLISVAVFFVLS